MNGWSLFGIVISSFLLSILFLIIIYFIIKFMTYRIATWIKIVNKRELNYEKKETKTRIQQEKLEIMKKNKDQEKEINFKWI